jgi:hypothetical protein
MRQQGRERARNVIDAPAETDRVRIAIEAALDPGFRAGLRGMENPYGNGTAAPTIAQVLATIPIESLLIKRPVPVPEEIALADFPEHP